MWRWRDWVIDAFNRNLPFDQFTIEQLAGDLLPRPTLDQLIATGFNRNHRGNAEGGIIPEEYLVEYAADRLETTATVWLGLTVGCARCHDHKYDPVSQKDYYRMLAYFNNIPERGKVVRFGNSPPLVKAPTKAQQEQIKQLQAKLKQGSKEVDFAHLLASGELANWEAKAKQAPPGDWSLTHKLLAHFPLDNHAKGKAGHPKLGQFKDGMPAFAPGKFGKAAAFDGKRYLDLGDVGDFNFKDKFTLSVWINPEGDKGGMIVSRMLENDRSEGYSLSLEKGVLHFNLVKRWLDDSLRVETTTKLVPGKWYHVVATYDGSRSADGIDVCVNGVRQELKINLDDLNQDFRTKAPFKVGAGPGQSLRFHGRIDELRLYGKALTLNEVESLATSDTIAEILKIPLEKRTTAQGSKLWHCFLERHAPKHIQDPIQRYQKLWQEWIALDESLPTVMVMAEMHPPRETFVLKRGAYDQKGEKVSRGLPGSLPPFPKGMPNNRLGFAQWLVDPAHPLTARVAVNRLWQMIFGTGLIKTAEDFGSQGEWPSHPELLDWLATEFVHTGWDVKKMLRLIVTSATYRQSSRVTPDLIKRDPDNRLLARGPRLRLSAHAIRDQALFISGLVVPKIGGPSVKIYQPPGLWKELADVPYVRDKGEKLYRRSLYVFWKRTVAPPALATFDAAGRESCVVRTGATNTPLQALNLLNDITHVEAARLLAERMLKQGGTDAAQRLAFAFRLATARPPSAFELKILVNGLAKHRQHYAANKQAALKLVSVGDWPRDPALEVGELAAYTAVAGVILNLDETITKQ
jgi:hypothetical protein